MLLKPLKRFVVTCTSDINFFHHLVIHRMASIKHLVSLLVFEVVAILPIILIVYWGQKYGKGFSWEVKDKRKFNYHPVFMIIAFIFVMGHGEFAS